MLPSLTAAPDPWALASDLYSNAVELKSVNSYKESEEAVCSLFMEGKVAVGHLAEPWHTRLG